MPVTLAPVAAMTSTIGYQDKGRAGRTFDKSLRLFLSRFCKEFRRLGNGLRQAAH